MRMARQHGFPPTDQAGWLNSAVRFVADEAEAWIAADSGTGRAFRTL